MMNFFNIINNMALNVSAETGRVSQDVSIDFSRIFGTLKHMGVGMLSIFLVIGIIIASIYALNKTMTNIEEKKAKKERNDQ